MPFGFFDGVHGAGYRMFFQTFVKTGIATLPSRLFDGLSGGANLMFCETFRESGLTEIPENLFGDSQLTTEYGMFMSMFSGCGKLKTIPADLFANVKGEPNDNLFAKTFMSCPELTGIPSGLFAGLRTDSEYKRDMFLSTFDDCPKLGGESAKIGDKYLYEIWPDIPMQYTYENDTGLTDYECIPIGWGGAGTKAPGTCTTDTATGAINVKIGEDIYHTTN